MSSRFFSFLVKIAFIFEPISPRFVSFLLGRKLKEWKIRRLIDDYKTKIKRIGKFHYVIDMNLDLTPEQVRSTIASLVVNARARNNQRD